MYEVQTLLEESGEEINILDPTRQLIQEGKIGYVPRDKFSTLHTSSPKIKDAYYFLFNNLLLVMKRTFSGSQQMKLHLPLDMALIPQQQAIASPEVHMFQVVESGKAVWTFVAASAEERDNISQTMNKLIEGILTKKYLTMLEQGTIFSFYSGFSGTNVLLDKHKSTQLSFEDFIRSHRDKPLPPPPPPKSKPKKLPEHPSGTNLQSQQQPKIKPPLPPNPSPQKKPPPPKPNGIKVNSFYIYLFFAQILTSLQSDSVENLKLEEGGQRKSLPPVPKTGIDMVFTNVYGYDFLPQCRSE